jgi:hypothetical protein
VLIGTAILLATHLLLVDVAMIGPLVAAWYDWRGRRMNQPAIVDLGRRLAWCAVAALVGGSVLGGVLLAGRYLFDERYFRAVAAIPTGRLWFAAVELLFSLVCLLVYAGTWRTWRKARVVHMLVAAAGATNLMMHFPALFAVISIVGSRPALLGRQLERAEFRRLLVDPEVLSRVVHVWLAAAAVTGLAVVWLALRQRSSRNCGEEQLSEELRESAIKGGARLALGATMLQFPVGLWVAFAMPEVAREPLLGGDPAASFLFLGSIGLAMVLVNVLSALVLSSDKTRQTRRATTVVVVLVFLMVTMRLRLAELSTPQPGKGAEAAEAMGQGLRRS